MSNPRHGYLENEVLSASPAKLHLMLVEGAIQTAEQARKHWHNGCNGLACEALIRAQEMVTAMTAGLNREADPELAGRLTAEYLFIFRTLIQANLTHSEQHLDDALRILVIERDTWRAACAQLKDPAESRPGAPLAPHFAAEVDAPASGFSIEA